MKETISEIEERIRSAVTLEPEVRTELLELLKELKTQIADLSKTHQEHAESITSLTEISAHEATRQGGNPTTLNLSVTRLRSSAQELEGSHPQLVAVVDRIAAMLANMGI